MLPKELLKEVRRIEIKTRHLVDSLYAGGYRSVFKGRGIEFAGIREYYRGDEFRSIDWKVSARSGRLHIREHIEERELQVVVALDLSASMAFGSGSREKRESAVEFAAAIGLAAERNNDRAGVCLFTDKVEKFIHPAKGRTHILRLIRELLYFIPQRRGTDLKAPLDFLNMTLSRRSVVFLVTDALRIGSIERELRIAAARHDLILVMVRDPREQLLPDVGLVEIADPETGDEMVIDTSDRAAMQSLVERQQQLDQQLIRVCRNFGMDLITLTAGESVVKPVCKLFAERERRITGHK
ncbi:MAG: DUF58 domain-containing protein [Candidatus Riflebacteria bacterium HGW-Riflebacteria-1]|jgi:uncharacterized protein (DUF58 family)|nr:MAG: DUF58 domain-containing protein [Candidatus Riflebacteria bacterium HGW-Riflebacteria-1]